MNAFACASGDGLFTLCSPGVVEDSCAEELYEYAFSGPWCSVSDFGEHFGYGDCVDVVCFGDISLVSSLFEVGESDSWYGSEVFDVVVVGSECHRSVLLELLMTLQ